MLSTLTAKTEYQMYDGKGFGSTKAERKNRVKRIHERSNSNEPRRERSITNYTEKPKPPTLTYKQQSAKELM